MLSQILSDFEFLDDWEDRYRYIIELGRSLTPLADTERTAENKVRGCASQVWLSTKIENASDKARFHFVGDSDALIVRTIALSEGKARPDTVRSKAVRFGEQ